MAKIGLYGDVGMPAFDAIAEKASKAGDRVYWRNRHGHKIEENEGFSVVVVAAMPEDVAWRVQESYTQKWCGRADVAVYAVDAADVSLASMLYPEQTSPSGDGPE